MGSISIANKADVGISLPNRNDNISSNNSIAANLPSGQQQFTPATVAQVSELGAKNETFNVNIKKLEKVTETEKTQKTFRLGSISTTFINPATTVTTNPVKPVSFKQTISKFNHNPLLSFMRGEVARNIPLKEEAIAVDNGFLGSNLNLIA